MVRHLRNLQSDPPNRSSARLAPYIVRAVLLTVFPMLPICSSLSPQLFPPVPQPSSHTRVIFEVGHFLNYFTSMGGGRKRVCVREILKAKRLPTKSVMVSNIEMN